MERKERGSEEETKASGDYHQSCGILPVVHRWSVLIIIMAKTRFQILAPRFGGEWQIIPEIFRNVQSFINIDFLNIFRAVFQSSAHCQEDFSNNMVLHA